MDCQKEGNPRITRRDFIKVTGAIIVVVGLGGCKRNEMDKSPSPVDTAKPVPTKTTGPWEIHVPASRSCRIPLRLFPMI
jgi:hypothetical protein